MEVGMQANGLHAAGEPWDGVLVPRRHQVPAPASESSISLESRYSPASRHKTTRPANRLKAKPADPTVISSIISSLDTLTPPPPEDPFDESSRRRLRRYEDDITVASSSSSFRTTTTAQGFGVEYGFGPALDHEGDLSDAALPPTIPTSRGTSGSGGRYPPLPPLPPPPHSPSVSSLRHVTSQNQFRSRPTSRGSTLSGTSERQGGGRNKLSAESWVRKNLQEEAATNPPRGRTPRKSLRRVTSQESLRPPHIESLLNQEAEHRPGTATGDNFIPRAPPKPQGLKERLYLRESIIGEQQPVIENPEVSQSTPIKKPLLETEPAFASEGQFSPVAETPLSAPSPISDSIPTRTSSLRQSSSSPASSKRKQRKSKKPTMQRIESIFPPRSKAIPESSWADLGDDDETVRRIKELREQRELRLESLQLFAASQVPMPPMQPGDEDIMISDLSARKTVDENLVHRISSIAPNRAMPEDDRYDQTRKSVDVHKSRGNYTNNVAPHHEAVDTSRRTKYSFEVKRPFSPQSRPPTSISDVTPTPTKLSLDYSYTDAVDALHGTEAENEHSAMGNALLVVPSSKSKRNRLEKARPGQSSPTDLERKKSRRKSASDARHKRIPEEDEEFQSRRNSVEVAVCDYLDAPRLSQTVHNPISNRTICFSEVGDPNGAAVFVCVGMGLTRYVTAFYDELATTLRLRLITLDRPGVGGSAPYPANDKSGPLNWPEDVLAICQHLNITRFSMLAHSAGAVYALATALIFPQMVNGKIHLLAPWIPPSQLEAIPLQATSSTPAGVLPRSQRFLRVLPPSFLKAANSSFMSTTSASLKPVKQRNVKNGAKLTRSGPEGSPAPIRERPMSQDGPEFNRRESMMLMDRFMPSTNPLEAFPETEGKQGDLDSAPKRSSLVLSATATPTDPSFNYAADALNAAEHTEQERHSHYTSRLTERTWEMATRDSNPATDLLVCLERHRDVGFRYTDVNRELIITHGAEDKRVPVANIKWLAQQINTRARSDAMSSVPSARHDCADPASGRPGCEVRILQGEGHGLMASPTIMGDILTEIAGYWVGHERGSVLR